MYGAGRVVGPFGRWGHTCLAADEEMAFLSSRSSSSARAEGVTGLAAPKRREETCTFHSVGVCIYGYLKSKHVIL